MRAAVRTSDNTHQLRSRAQAGMSRKGARIESSESSMPQTILTLLGNEFMPASARTLTLRRQRLQRAINLPRKLIRGWWGRKLAHLTRPIEARPSRSWQEHLEGIFCPGSIIRLPAVSQIST